MPPSIALLGCVLFVLVLLRQEAKESAGGVTPFLWVPTVWFLITASRSLGLWLGTGGATIEEGSATDRMSLFVLFVIALATLMARQFPWSTTLRDQKWVVMLLAFMLLSCVWSDTFFISFKRWFRDAIAVVMCMCVLSEPRPRMAIESLLRRVIYICIPFSYVLIHYFPEYGKIYVHTEGVEMWTGVTLHKNQLAQLCLISFLLISWRIATRKPNNKQSWPVRLSLFLEVVILLITMLLFIGPDRRITYSATALLATVAGLGTLGFLLWHQRRGTQPALFLVVAVTAFLIGYGTLTPFLGKLSLLDVSSAVGRTSNLTGRGEVWKSLHPAVSKSPFLGYGYGAFWTTEAREIYDISDAHNGYLGVILETGFVGLLLYAMFLLSAAINAHRFFPIDYNWGALCLIFAVSILLHNIGESSLNSFSARLTGLLLLLNLSCNNGESELADTELGRNPVGNLSKEECRGEA